MDLRPLDIFKFFQRGDRLSDVHRRQILTYKDVPRGEKANNVASSNM